MGRIRTDGVFEFVGRVDEQVKIRGIRVELGDIEAALQEHPDVRCAAVVRGETPSGTRLTAYIVPRCPDPIPTAELRAFVGDRIPPALIPNRFESVAALPLTPSGKLDRRALPALTCRPKRPATTSPRGPSSSAAHLIVGRGIAGSPYWRRRRLFRDRRPFTAGRATRRGHRQNVGRALSPGLLFDAPTIEPLASRLAVDSSAAPPWFRSRTASPAHPCF